ncbi:hypothetical protein EKD04_013120 [Chloroflexales bacterium ZM16-3]|nr:hypothetical protein [Chloroflexales bacterium ZM16-3]
MRAHSSYGKVVQFLPTAHLKLEEFKAVYARWAERGDPISLIWTELLARLDVVQGIVFFHASLGLALFTLFPFTYIFNFVALYYSARRRSIRAVA